MNSNDCKAQMFGQQIAVAEVTNLLSSHNPRHTGGASPAIISQSPSH